jgi:hypothetical protein
MPFSMAASMSTWSEPIPAVTASLSFGAFAIDQLVPASLDELAQPPIRSQGGAGRSRPLGVRLGG